MKKTQTLFTFFVGTHASRWTNSRNRPQIYTNLYIVDWNCFWMCVGCVVGGRRSRQAQILFGVVHLLDASIIVRCSALSRSILAKQNWTNSNKNVLWRGLRVMMRGGGGRLCVCVFLCVRQCSRQSSNRRIYSFYTKGQVCLFCFCWV